MEQFYLILVVVLFALAISDLVVGVSNDAVNFLNSAIGSKAAPMRIIFLIASAGVLIGATFSSGMMEVARKGIFHPDMFFFSEIMIIFMAVMITDIILLDLFNTLALPTSTTVSIVFELLGAAVAVSVIKISHAGESLGELNKYINSDKALAIIGGIVLSVFTAFIVGAVVQYITRIIFTFKEKNKTIKYFGSIFGGLAITAITFFMIIKGAKGASFLTEDIVAYLNNNMFIIMIVSFVFWTLILQLLYSIFKIDIPKVIVLVGTFSLSMAFAGNDLVNFIGVPLAGFSSFKAWIAAGSIAPESFDMGILNDAVQTPTYMLMIAGFIMIITLITSKKAREVVKTEVNLGRQDEGQERFGSSMISRSIVRSMVRINKTISTILPRPLMQRINSRFEPEIEEEVYKKKEDKPAFDKIRASVNLIVASILISIATSLKLPLSTTYVTFMVAMGTSLSDRAWDRDSAVFRITGVFTVIGGWFLTALIAFTVGGFIAAIISLFGNYMVFLFIAIAIFMIARTYILFKKRSAQDEEDEDEYNPLEVLIENNRLNVINTITHFCDVYILSLNHFIEENDIELKKSLKSNKSYQKKIHKAKDKFLKAIQKLDPETLEGGHYHIRIIDHEKDVIRVQQSVLNSLYEHVGNQHKPFISSQVEDIKKLVDGLNEWTDLFMDVEKNKQSDRFDELISHNDQLKELIIKFEKAQIKRIKNKEVSTRNSVLFFGIMNETKNMLSISKDLIHEQQKFISYSRKGM